MKAGSYSDIATISDFFGVQAVSEATLPALKRQMGYGNTGRVSPFSCKPKVEIGEFGDGPPGVRGAGAKRGGLFFLFFLYSSPKAVSGREHLHSKLFAPRAHVLGCRTRVAGVGTSLHLPYGVREGDPKDFTFVPCV